MQQIRALGLIDTLRQFHDDIDRATLAAYGWPYGLTDDEISGRLLHLNAQRVAEEAVGHIRWLRPVFQNRTVQAEVAKSARTESAPEVQLEAANPWPVELPDRIRSVVQVLQSHDRAVPVAEIPAAFPRA